MGAFIIVEVYPLIKINLQLGSGTVDFLSECDLIKLLQYGLVKALADAIGLRMLHSGFGVINVIDGEEQLEVVLVSPATIFRASVSEDSQHRQIVVLMVRQNLVIQQIRKIGRASCRERVASPV